MADTIRGDGLLRAERALAALIEEPQRLDRARTRFVDSPPSYTSHQSHNSTRSQSPSPPNEELRRREERKWQQIRERYASLPREQFAAQKREETERIYKAIGDRTLRVRVGTNVSQLAWDSVKNSWAEQGIWNNKWNVMADGLWKHEELLEPEPESGTDMEAGLPCPPFAFTEMEPRPKLRRAKSVEEKQQIAERRAFPAREREASRPFHQFIYQVSKERDRIQGESETGKTDAAISANINTSAYENVKNTWTRRGIWNAKWGILPGMSWKHEEPLEEETADGPALVRANPLDNDSREARELCGAPLSNISGRPVTDNSESCMFMSNSCIESNLRPASTTARLANGNAESLPPGSNSPPSGHSRQVVPFAAGHTVRSGKRNPSHRDGQAQPLTIPYLGPVRSSKVSKAPTKRRLGLKQRPNATVISSSDDLQLLPEPDIAEAPQRRSERVHTKERGAQYGPAGIASADPTKTVSRSRPKRIAGASPKAVGANPQGISKRRHSGRTRRE